MKTRFQLIQTLNSTGTTALRGLDNNKCQPPQLEYKSCITFLLEWDHIITKTTAFNYK